MKTLNIPLEEKEYRELMKTKGKMSWKQFMFSKIKGERGEDRIESETSSHSHLKNHSPAIEGNTYGAKPTLKGKVNGSGKPSIPADTNSKKERR